jgi:hypothetical protein
MTESAAFQEETGRPIHEITSRTVVHGALSGSFESGAAAVLLCGDERVPSLFQSVLEWLGLEDSCSPDWFGNHLIDLARNHLQDNVHIGDMIRFQPGVFGHIARKFVVFQEGADQPLRAFPNSFYINSRRIPVPYDILEAAWSLKSDVLMSVMPPGINPLEFAVELDVLVYPTCGSDIYRLYSLLADSCGAWARLGHQIDANKGNALGWFDKKIARECFAIMSLIPGLKNVMTALNNRSWIAGDDGSNSNYSVIGGPHIDKSKYVTGLIGSRSNLQTQIYSEKRWVPLPVTSDMMTIFPGLRIGSLSKIPPTLHRILLESPVDEQDSDARNITLSLALVSRPTDVPKETIER